MSFETENIIHHTTELANRSYYWRNKHLPACNCELSVYLMKSTFVRFRECRVIKRIFRALIQCFARNGGRSQIDVLAPVVAVDHSDGFIEVINVFRDICLVQHHLQHISGAGLNAGIADSTSLPPADRVVNTEV